MIKTAKRIHRKTLINLSCTLIFFVLFNSLCVFAATEEVVVSGNLNSSGSVVVGVVESTQDGIKVTYQNNIVYAKHSFAPGNFTVTANIKIPELTGKESAFIFDNNKLFFDYPQSSFCDVNGALGFWGRELIGDGIDGYYGIKKLADPGVKFSAGSFFKFQLICDGIKLRFYIDDSLIGEADYKTQQNHSFGFTGHNGIIIIKDFKVEGTIAGDAELFYPDWANGIRMRVPVIEYPLSIKEDQFLFLRKQHITPAGQYTAEIKPAGGGNAVSFNLTISDVTPQMPLGGRSFALLSRYYVAATIPQNVLQSCYANDTSRFNSKPFILSLSQNGVNDILLQDLVLFDPDATNDFPNCSITSSNGSSSISVESTPLGTVSARLASLSRAERFSGVSIRDFAEAGVNLFIITVNPSDFYVNGQFDLDAIYDYIELRLTWLTANAPDALIWLDWELYMPAGWCDLYPNEMIALENGLEWLENSPDNILQPSYASDQWKVAAGYVLKTTLQTLKSSKWADRCIMVRTLYANAGEWNHWGYKSSQFVDFSIPMQTAFRKWLQNKYSTDANLQTAWGDTQITLASSDLVPHADKRIADDDYMLYNVGAQKRPAVDYYTFFQGKTVGTIYYFANVIKNASDNKLLAGAYYGYYLHHINESPYHKQDSGHFGLRHFLQLDNLDFIGGPYPYLERKDRLQLNSLFSSINLHNKIWLSENDMRTHLCDWESQIQYGATDNLGESIAIAKRDYMVNFSKGTSYYFYDFIKDWFESPEFMQVVKRVIDIDKISLANSGRQSKAEVAVIFSEASVWFYSNQPLQYNSSQRVRLSALRNMFEKILDRCGAPWDLYEISDMSLIDFSKYKLVIFANADYVTDEIIQITNDELFNQGKTVLFLGTPGIIDVNGDNLDYSRCEQFTGIKLTSVPAGNYYHKITGLYNGIGFDLEEQTLSDDYWINPALEKKSRIVPDFPYIFYPYWGFAMAFYENSTQIAVARKAMGLGESILCTAVTPPTSDFFKEIYNIAGVHNYLVQADAEDSFYCAGDLAAIYSRKGGTKVIRFPGSKEIIMNVFTGEILAQNTDEVTLNLSLNVPETIMLFAGSQAVAQQYQQ